MTVLITGLGYIGAQLADDLLSRGESIVALENYFCTPRHSLSHFTQGRNLTLVEGSINRLADIRRALRAGSISAVVHLAAQPSAHPRAATARYTELTNLQGARLVLEAAIAAGVERVVLGSSFKVYGDLLPDVVTEQQPYGQVGDLVHLSKIYSEKLGEMLAATRGLRCVAVRLGITHGLGPVMKSDPRFMTVPNRFAQLAALGDPLTVHAGATKPAGFIELRDASLALQDALGLHLAEPYRAVNAVGECASVIEVARLVQQAAGTRGLTVSSSGPRKGETRAVRVETSLSTAVFRKPRRLADSIPEVLDFFLRSR